MKLIYWIGLAMTTWKLSLANKKIDELTIEKEEIAKKALDLALAKQTSENNTGLVKLPDAPVIEVQT